MSDRDELKLKIRDAIWNLDSQSLKTGHWEDPLTYAEAALSAIEAEGYVIMPSSLSLNKRRIIEAMCQTEEDNA
jgi:hypothetical protein